MDASPWMVLAWFAPAVAQCVMLAVMVLDRRWLFVAMMAPGIVTCLVSAMANVPRLRQRQRERRERAAAGGASAASGSQAASGHGNEGDGGRFPDLATVPLESLLVTGAPHGGPPDGVRVDWRQVLRQWCCGDMAAGVPVGLGVDGTMGLDLVSLGPHALVAGTTGSGKSLFLEAWCASFAFAMPPERLNFVFLDFKGGSTFRAIRRLPHAVGCVSDLDLRHARRALKAIEAELKRRERMAASQHVAGFDQMTDPPPRLIVVVDEFHALKDQLPGYVDRLVSLASLGRSLGMNLVLCTQNPMGQLSPQLKANINLNVCLRVRDTMQSKELIGSGLAGRIPAALPGAAWAHDGDRTVPLRCAPLADARSFADACGLAHRFRGGSSPVPLFSPPLPRSVTREGHAVIAMVDDGVATRPLELDPTRGPIAIVGPPGRGKTTLLATIGEALEDLGIPVARRSPEGLAEPLPPPPPSRRGIPSWALLVDDADALLDPMGGHPGRARLLEALRRPGPFVAFCLTSARHLRHPEHCAVRVVFPCGDKTADTFAGIPPAMHGEFSPDDCHTPGRAALVDGARHWPVQCASPREPRDAGNRRAAPTEAVFSAVLANTLENRDDS